MWWAILTLNTECRWGTLKPRNEKRKVTIVFLLAISKEEEMAVLREEAAEHNDLIFLDTVRTAGFLLILEISTFGVLEVDLEFEN